MTMFFENTPIKPAVSVETASFRGAVSQPIRHMDGRTYRHAGIGEEAHFIAGPVSGLGGP